jgi:hypothetical protein
MIIVVTMPPETARMILSLIVASSVVLMLTRPSGIPEVWWISGGALLLIVLRLIPLPFAGQAVAEVRQWAAERISKSRSASPQTGERRTPQRALGESWATSKKYA